MHYVYVYVHVYIYYTPISIIYIRVICSIYSRPCIETVEVDFYTPLAPPILISINLSKYNKYSVFQKGRSKVIYLYYLLTLFDVATVSLKNFFSGTVPINLNNCTNI